MRMQGYNVLFPMGFDAFGLPAENAAIKRGIHPDEWTYANIERMRGQLRRMGAMLRLGARGRHAASPEYYKWTQWFFLQFYKNGLAYRASALVNWCPELQDRAGERAGRRRPLRALRHAGRAEAA